MSKILFCWLCHYGILSVDSYYLKTPLMFLTSIFALKCLSRSSLCVLKTLAKSLNSYINQNKKFVGCAYFWWPLISHFPQLLLRFTYKFEKGGKLKDGYKPTVRLDIICFHYRSIYIIKPQNYNTIIRQASWNRFWSWRNWATLEGQSISA